MRLLLGLIFLASLIQGAQAAPYPVLTGRVVDEANIISDNMEYKLSQMLLTHEGKTSNQVVVVTVPSLGGMSIENYTRNLGNHWRIGVKGKDNGVVILIAPFQKEARIEVADGVLPLLTDEKTSKIMQHFMIPYFKKKEYDRGLYEATKLTLSILEGQNPALHRTWWSILQDYVAYLLLIPGIYISRKLGLDKRFVKASGSNSGSRFKGGGGSFRGGGSSGKW